MAGMSFQEIINRFDQTARQHSPFPFWPVGQAEERFGSSDWVDDVIRHFVSVPKNEVVSSKSVKPVSWPMTQ